MATLQDYLGITALRDAWPKWKANVIAINNQVINHVAGSADKHAAQDITYTGDFAGKTEVKAALDQAKTEIDTIVVNASIDPEVAFARDSAVKSKVFGSLDDRLEEDEQDLVTYKADYAYYDKEGIPRDYTSDATTGINNYLQWCKVNKKNAYFLEGDFIIDGEILWPEGVSIAGMSYSSNTDYQDGYDRAYTRFYFTNPVGSGVRSDHEGRTLRGRITGIGFINQSGNSDKILLDIKGVQSSCIEYNTFTGPSGIGIRLEGDGSFNFIKRNRFRYLEKGLQFTGTATADGNSILNNDFFSNGKGVDFSGTANANVVMFNNFALNAEHDIYMYKGSINFIKYNRIESSAALYPIELTNTSRFNEIADNFITHQDPAKILVKDNPNSYGANTIKLRYTGFYSTPLDKLFSYESKITYDSGKNLLPDARFPKKSPWIYVSSGLTVSETGIDSDGYGMIDVTNSNGAETALAFSVPASLGPYLAGKPVTVGVFAKSANQTTLRIQTLYSDGGALERTVAINNTGWSLNTVNGYRPEAGTPTQFFIYIGAGQTVSLKEPVFFLGATYIKDIIDSYSFDAERSFTTVNRPPLDTSIKYYQGYDITLAKPIYWNGAVWKDFAGTTV